MSKGILIFAFNNEKIDYEKIANANKLMIEYNMDVPVHIISKTTETVSSTTRHYRDYNETLSFNNGLRWDAFHLSPFDETLVLDADYLIMNNRLNAIWGNVNSLMMNTQIQPLYANEFIENDRLNAGGINMAWATAIYFKKTKLAETFFTLMKHVHDNYLYYRQVYELEGNLYRNDFSASIARHMLNGFTENTTADIPSLPTKKIVTAKAEDEIIQFNGINKVKVKISKPERLNEYIVNSVKHTNIHFLNKKTILDNYDSIVELYS
jgi:hypothetical protein